MYLSNSHWQTKSWSNHSKDRLRVRSLAHKSWWAPILQSTCCCQALLSCCGAWLIRCKSWHTSHCLSSMCRWMPKSTMICSWTWQRLTSFQKSKSMKKSEKYLEWKKRLFKRTSKVVIRSQMTRQDVLEEECSQQMRKLDSLRMMEIVLKRLMKKMDL